MDLLDIRLTMHFEERTLRTPSSGIDMDEGEERSPDCWAVELSDCSPDRTTALEALYPFVDGRSRQGDTLAELSVGIRRILRKQP